MTVPGPIRLLALGLIAALALAAPTRAQYNTGAPEAVRDLDIAEKPGSTLPLDAILTDSSGRQVPLSAYFDSGDRSSGKPVVLLLVYYDCPGSCPMIFANTAKCMNALDYDVGNDFTFITVSFDPTNTTAQAHDWKQRFLSSYNRQSTPEVVAGIETHTTSEENARAIADAVGFDYRYFPDTGEFGHPSGIFILTPDGRLSRTLYGSGWDVRPMKLALLDASDGKIAKSFGDKLLQWCYHFDPKTGTYSASAFLIMQIVAVVTAIGLVTLVVAMKVAERRRIGQES